MNKSQKQTSRNQRQLSEEGRPPPVFNYKDAPSEERELWRTVLLQQLDKDMCAEDALGAADTVLAHIAKKGSSG